MDSEGRASPSGEPFPAIPLAPFAMIATPAQLPIRKPLGHQPPSWVAAGETFFITICAQSRANAPLLIGAISQGLIASAKFLHDRGDWFVRVFLVMPDHVHGLIAVPSATALATRISTWKGYTRKSLGVAWQSRFFDHRIRSNDSLDEKAGYIRLNPVRAGLVRSADKWPHVFDAFAAEASAGTLNGSAGTPRPT